MFQITPFPLASITCFDDIPALNRYVAKRLAKIDKREDKQLEIDNLIRVISQNNGLLGEGSLPSTSQDLVQYLKLTHSLKIQTESDFLRNCVLEPVTRAALSVFTNLSNEQPSIVDSLGTIQELNQISRETYLQTLAGWIAEKQIRIHTLNLSKEELLELAPYLTFLDLMDMELSVSDPDFVGSLLEKTEKLVTLQIKGSSALPKLKNSQDLQKLHIEVNLSHGPSHDFLLNFILSIYLVDPARALQLTKPSINITEAGLLQHYFKPTKYRQTESIRKLLDKIGPGELGTIVRRNDIPFVHEEFLKKDPLQRMYLFNLFSKISPENIPFLKTILEPLIVSPMYCSLEQFYKSVVTINISVAVLKWLVEIVSTPPVDGHELLNIFAYFIQENIDQAAIVKNLVNLRATGHLAQFMKKFPPTKEVSYMLEAEDVFTDNAVENKKTLSQIIGFEFDYQVHKKNQPREPWNKLTERQAHATVGKAFIRLHFSDFVKNVGLQDMVLGAFPPTIPKNLGLYPREYSLSHEGDLEFYVVPTLPLADAPQLVNEIVSIVPYIKSFKVIYYGSPAADHSGPGRQLVSELAYGCVVNQKSLFTRLSTGGMYPYDPTHTLGAYGNRKRYNDLGRFLGLAMRLQYPIGLILSEKTLNCMLAFSGNDLIHHDFNIETFIKKMDAAAFIHFMRTSSNEDEASVTLYEKVFLSDIPEEVIEAASTINGVFEDDSVGTLIAGGAGNNEQIRARLTALWIDDHSYSLTAAYAMAQGMSRSKTKNSGQNAWLAWEDVRHSGVTELSKHLQGELSADYVKEHIQVRVLGGETPLKCETADNVREWTDEWIDDNGDDQEKLANFVQSITGARAMTKDIYLDINPEYNVIEAHTCFNRVDIPPGVNEGFLKMMWDEFALGNPQFDRN